MRPPGSVRWAVGALRRKNMPREEIRAVLGADDPDVIRRYLELHQERLEEWLLEERRTLARVEGFLTRAILERQETARTISSVSSGYLASSWARSCLKRSMKPVYSSRRPWRSYRRRGCSSSGSSMPGTSSAIS
jgi:hypothetical protein